LLAGPQSVLNGWKNFFNQVLNIYGVHDVRQMDIHMVEPLVPEPSLIEVETTTGKLLGISSVGSVVIDQLLIRFSTFSRY
jgi:hypothetical protein